MLLRTFGGLSLEAHPGEEPAPPFGPRRLALLAIIAASNAHGITREKILGILWPDVGEEQGRHTLSQTLYSIRRESDGNWVSGATQLKLDPSLRSDVTDFLAALKSDDLERVAELYTGQFLEGFYLASAPDFERWMDETRSRLHFSALKAIETLARRSDSAGNTRLSLDAWRRLTELEPLKSAYAAGYLKALIAAGEHGTALKFAADHESRVRGELEMEPEPAIARIIAEIRSAPRPLESSDTGALSVATTVESRESAVGTGEASERRTASVETAKGPTRNRKSVITVGVVLLASFGAAFVTVNGAVPWRNGARVPLLAVGSIASRDTAEHSIVLRNLLATNLARLSGIHVVSNTRLAELASRPNDSSQSAAAEAAKRAGASDILEGELGVTSNGLALTLRRVSLATGMVLHGYTLRASDIFALTDSASIAIARDFRIDPPSEVLATVRTRSAVAYALYENGMSALSHNDVLTAYELLCAALARDSTFAMAAAHAWSVSLALEKRADAARLLPIVARLGKNTIERERLWIESLIVFHTGAPLAEQLASIEKLTRKYPGDPDGQLLRGLIMFNAGDFGASVEAHERVVFIDSSTAPYGSYCRVCRAITYMAGAYIWWDSLEAAERASLRLASLPYKGRMERGELIETLLRLGRRADAERVVAEMRSARPGDVLDFSGPFNRDLIRQGRLAELEASLLSSLKTAAPGAHGEMPWLLMFILRNQGRLDEAYLLANEGVVPGINVQLADFHDPLTTAVVALERGDAREASRRFMEMVAVMRSSGYNPGSPWARHMSFRMTLAGMALAAVGDTGTARALADSIAVISQRSNWSRDLRIHHFLRGLVHQKGNRHDLAVEEFRKAVFSLTDGLTRINVEMARSLLALKRNDEAIAVLRPALRGGVDGGNTYTTHTELHELMGEAFYAAGRKDSAAVHYGAVEKAWRRADARFAERYRIAKVRSER